jgi:DNA-binding NarL/FixJ family response regulator
MNDERLVDAVRHALIVEDEPEFAAHVADAVQLLPHPWRLTTRNAAAGALQAMGDPAARIDLALVDIGLPDRSGVEVIRELRQRFPECVILTISVVSSERTVLAAIRAGANGYLLKGDPVLTIVAAIDEVLAGRYPISPALAGYLFKLATLAPLQADASESMPALTPRETELLRHFADGCSYAVAAQKMGISLSTVQNHVQNLYRKLGANSQAQAVGVAWRSGLL